MPHFPHHVIAAGVALIATLALATLSVNRLVRRKLRPAMLLFGGYLLAHAALAFRPDLLPGEDDFRSYERLAFAAGTITLLVVSLVNPLRVDRTPDRFPSIVQDAINIGLLLLVATFALGDKFLATSAVSAVVIGFALQDTLGNAFAGLAIQSEKPFRVGHWVTIGEHEGRVTEVTWRATKLRTKSGNFVVLPNSEVGKTAITNFSEPVAPTRLFVDVGITYDAAPNRVKGVLKDAIRDCSLILRSPEPQVLVMSFDDSAIRYRIQYWIADYEKDELAWDQVRTSVYYALRRTGIEIPYPIAVEIGREDRPPDVDALARDREAVLERLDLFAPLTPDQRRQVAASTTLATFGDAEVIVRESDAGDSMFVVVSGAAAILVNGGTTQVAVTEAGGYFGEMSLLTGEPRSATVRAVGDTTVLEIPAAVFRGLAQSSPHAVEQVGVAAATRRLELDRVRAATAAAAAVADVPGTLLAKMRRFLGIG
jgi:small-conductance mechanosensitive channel/CRP-like cAMP-binding protein